MSLSRPVVIGHSKLHAKMIRILEVGSRGVAGTIHVADTPLNTAAVGELLTDGYIEPRRPLLGERCQSYRITDRGRLALDNYRRGFDSKPSGVERMELHWFPFFIAAGVIVAWFAGYLPQ